MSQVRSLLKRARRAILGEIEVTAGDGAPPGELTETQRLFLEWNAERLGIPLRESQSRYFHSWAALRGGHAGDSYRAFNDLSYRIFEPFFGDAEREVYDAYQFHGPMHFLRMLSYPEPHWRGEDELVRLLQGRARVDILDYGCGLAQRSRTLAAYLQERGVGVTLHLADIPTVRRGFLLWLGVKTGIATAFLDCVADAPLPDLPACDLCFANEVFEHVYDPLRHFAKIDAALRAGAVLETNVSDHAAEFMHVSPSLGALRDRLAGPGYEAIVANRLYRKR
jgi:SAM-dependent methyltransferase